MRILHFINDLETKGGAEQLVSQYILNDNHQVITLKTLKRSLLSIKQTLHLINLLKQIDIVHIHLFPCLYIGLIFKIIFNKSIIYTEHNSWNRRRKYKILRVVEKYIYNKYDKIICISEGVKDALIQWIGPNKNVLIVENGINLSTQFIKFPYKRDLQNFTILMIGRFSKQKNQELLIDYVSKNSDTNLILVGDGPKLPRCKNLSKALNLTDRVCFVQAKPHPIILPHKPDLYVQCSNWEGFGLTVVEAISDGIPAIGSAVPGLSSILKKFHTFENNAISLSEAIKKVKLETDYLNYQTHEVNKYDFDNHLIKLNKIYDCF